MLVPWSSTNPPPFLAEVIATPGANMSDSVSSLWEKTAMTSVLPTCTESQPPLATPEAQTAPTESE